jgi:hypothetical protein
VLFNINSILAVIYLNLIKTKNIYIHIIMAVIFTYFIICVPLTANTLFIIIFICVPKSESELILFFFFLSKNISYVLHHHHILLCYLTHIIKYSSHYISFYIV